MHEALGQIEQALPILRDAEVVHRRACELKPGLEEEHHFWTDAHRRVAAKAR